MKNSKTIYNAPLLPSELAQEALAAREGRVFQAIVLGMFAIAFIILS